MTDVNFPVLPRPAQSPDLNIMKNIWKMLEDITYDRSAVLNIANLKKDIQKAFLVINTTKIRIIINLYETFRNCLVKVIVNNGNQINNYLLIIINYALSFMIN